MSADKAKELAEVKAEIIATKAELIAVKNVLPLDVPRRNRLEDYLAELQKEKNHLAGTDILHGILRTYSFLCFILALVDADARRGGKQTSSVHISDLFVQFEGDKSTEELRSALLNATINDKTSEIRLPVGMRFPVEPSHPFAGVLLVRQAQKDVNIVFQKMLMTKQRNTMLLLGPAGIGKVLVLLSFVLFSCFSSFWSIKYTIHYFTLFANLVELVWDVHFTRFDQERQNRCL